MNNAILFEDVFDVQKRDPDGKKFDKVSRYVLKSDLYEFEVTVDINIDIFPLQVGEKVSLCLARTIHKDGTAETGKYDKTFPGFKQTETLLDSYDYAMHGKVFKYGDNSSGGATKLEIYFSFGGLLMKLVGNPDKLNVIQVDSPVYLLIRRL
ncbi:DNA-directed RNA polymerase IV and V subunit 8B-like [Raphidocelis subcapitata]|uniref:DNA-directed RNA polymerase IV and V subunit 8B-like n=1 Tax=Raphidocelis subcapitata TaxID=307507 RepID=A0A2V0NPE7_9CHLO|nr:DNA-directed RNA polymerase IV and V subunit 8B-like [Raphidocelis subcapitata]|eukprot:GBF88412.1 DNA-directed RNA polymerase IV and V subunit 8B-like [Raphidocelis subcapitata]